MFAFTQCKWALTETTALHKAFFIISISSLPFALRKNVSIIITAKLREGNVFKGVCLATGVGDPCLWSHVPYRGGGLCLWFHVPSRGLPDRDLPGLRPPRQRPNHLPWTEDRDPSPLYDKERAVCILLECILVSLIQTHFALLVDAVADLSKSEWMDKYTKALFVEFILYNANVNLFSYVTVLLEWPRTNSPLYSLKVHSFR